MDKTRLKEVVNVLRTKVEDKDFNIDYWAMEEECGTVACAIGHYCLNHPKAALKLRKVDKEQYDVYYKGAWAHDAIADYFNISIDESVKLFAPSSYPYNRTTTKEMVADKIEEFIK